MDESEARSLLGKEIEVLRALSYEELRQLRTPYAKEVAGRSGQRYQIEVDSFRDDRAEEDLRVVVLIDDGGLRAFKPLSDDFAVGPDGSFIGESKSDAVVPGSLPMIPPIIVRSEGDLDVYDSPSEAARWAEWIDVEDGIYRGWDSRGIPLVFEVVEREGRGLFGRKRIDRDVVLRVASETPDEMGLRKEIVDFLSRLARNPEALARLPLDELVARAKEVYGR